MEKALPGDIVEIDIIKEKKDYIEGKIKKLITSSKIRKEPICPYFFQCGGCTFLNTSLSESLDYKIRNINELLQKEGINYEVSQIIKSKKPLNYRNKITLKIVNKKIGYFASDSHDLVEIDYCYLCHETINDIIKDIPFLGIKNGLITIRVNYKDEILLHIESKDKLNNIDKLNELYKIAGIIYNDEVIFGSPFLIDKIGDYLFKISYDAFFQVNPFICEEIGNYIKEYTKNSHKIMDLYAGVGMLGIMASNNLKEVVGIEIVENAVKDALINKNFNHVENAKFFVADTKNILDKITNNYDTIILDPPRSGVNKAVIDKIKKEKIKNIIYISCHPQTLVRDLKLLYEQYEINNMLLFDMFAQTSHVESFCVLNLR